jgi:Flp pilus assembly pilin Flp
MPSAGHNVSSWGASKAVWVRIAGRGGASPYSRPLWQGFWLFAITLPGGSARRFPVGCVEDGGANMSHLFRKLWRHEEGQDIAEYAVMLAVILVLVVGTIRLIGGNANNVFSSAASSLQ